MSAMASQIIGISIVCSTVYSGADQRSWRHRGPYRFFLHVVNHDDSGAVLIDHKLPETLKQVWFWDFADDVTTTWLGTLKRVTYGYIHVFR